MKNFISLPLQKAYFILASVVAVGVLVAFLAGWYHLQYERRERASYVEKSLEIKVEALKNNLSKYREFTRSLQSSLSMNALSEEAFQEAYQEAMEKSKLQDVENVFFVRQSRQGNTYQLRWLGSGEPSAALKKTFERNPSVIDTYEQSELLNKTITSELIELPRSSSSSSSVGSNYWFVNTLPVFTGSNLDGFVSVLFNPFANISFNEKEDDYVVRIRDFSSDSHEMTVLYQGGHARSALPVLVQHIDAGGRNWIVEVFDSKATIPSLWPLSTVFLMLFVTGLAGLVMFRSIQDKTFAEDLAKELNQKFTSIDNKFHQITETLPGVVMVVDKEYDVQEMNRTARELLGEGLDQISLTSFVSHKDFVTGMDMILRGHYVSYTVPSMHLQSSIGHDVWWSVSMSKMLVEDTIHVLVLANDISDMVKMSNQLDAQTKKLHFMATHDQLTGLFNRRAFESEVDVFIQSRPRFAMLYIDLDQFKIVNDTAGHLAGDKLLLEISDGLRDLIPCFFARLGGDEFGVLIEGDERQALSIAQSVISYFEKYRFEWEGKTYQVTASVGVALSDHIRRDLSRPLNREDLMARADAACYMSKQGGRNRCHVFSQNGESFVHQQEMEWTVRIHQAIADNRLILYRQPIAPLDPYRLKNSLPHFEILARMRDEDGNIIPANEFIPAAERFGLMPLFDRWVLEYALSNFKDLCPNGFSMCSINISGQTIDDPSFETFLFDLIERTQVNPKKICLEITETAAIKNMERMSWLLPKIKNIGCKLALDDFGVGMSSFAYLKNFEVDYIKIDGSFVRDIEKSVMSESIVSAVTDLAHKMNIQVVAEWVSSEEVASLLRSKGVDYAQGYFVGKPTPIFDEGEEQ